MALNKQTWALTFAGGLDQKTDANLVNPGKLLVAENAVFNKEGRIDKRNGYKMMQTANREGGDVTTGTALTTFNKQLLQFADSKLFAYSSGSAQWSNKGNAVSLTVDTDPFLRNTFQQVMPDMAYLGDYGCAVFEDSERGVMMSQYDDSSELPTISEYQLNLHGENPKVLPYQNNFYVFYSVSGSADLRGRIINPLSPTGVGPEVTLSTNMGDNAQFDVTIFGSQFFLAHQTNVNTVKTLYVTNALAIGQTGLIASASAENAITVYVTSVSRPAVVWADSGSVNAIVLEPNLVPFGSGSLVLDTLNGVRNLGAISFNGKGTIYYEVEGDITANHYIKRNTFVETTTVIGTPEVFARSVGLGAKPFAYTQESETNSTTPRHYVVGIHESIQQPTYFVLQDDGYLVSKIEQNGAGGLTYRSGLPNVSTIRTGVYRFPTLQKGRTVSKGKFVTNPDGSQEYKQTISYNTIGLARTELDFTGLRNYAGEPLGGNLTIVGGMVSIYDGVQVVEAGYNLFPEELDAAYSDTGGAIQSGSYQYTAVYEWQDNSGQVHESAPATLKLVKVPNGTSTNTVYIEVPTLRLTNKPNVTIVLYRSENNQVESLYRVTPLAEPVYNDPTVDSVLMIDTLSDDELNGNQLLYTVGGVFEHIAPPPASLLTVHKNRVWLAGLADGNTLWYSFERAPGAPVNYFDGFTLPVDTAGGDITAIFSLEDKLIIAKRGRLYFTYGEGPDETGANGSFAQPILITADVGVVSQNSVVETPTGVFFQSTKGIYVILPDRSIQYVGAAVEDHNDLTIVASTLVANANQVRFLTETGVALVFDTYKANWSTFLNHFCFDATIWEDQFVYLNRDGSVWRELPGFYLDVSQYYSLNIVTPWIKLAEGSGQLPGLQGFFRLYRTMLLMEFRSSHLFTMEMAYDHEQTFTDSFIFDPDRLGFNVYGDGAYGEISPYGGASNGVYQFRVHHPRQKLQAIKLRFRDVQPADGISTGQGFSILGMSMMMGMKNGLGRLPSAQSI